MEQQHAMDSRIHRRTWLALVNLLGNRIQVGTTHTYPLRRKQFGLGKFQLGMASAEHFARGNSYPWDTQDQLN